MDYQTVGIVLGALFFITGGLATLYKFLNTIRKEREAENEKILAAAKTYTDAKFEKLEMELAHQKDLHEGKIAELSHKIDELKEEMSRHHSQLMDLLVKKLSSDEE
jgi:uncharacterized coiled-coil protein SlyX